MSAAICSGEHASVPWVPAACPKAYSLLAVVSQGGVHFEGAMRRPRP
jgi:hypothetical protein